MQYVHKIGYVRSDTAHTVCSIVWVVAAHTQIELESASMCLIKKRHGKHGMQNNLLVIYTWRLTRRKCLNSNFHHTNNVPYEKWVFVNTSPT